MSARTASVPMIAMTDAQRLPDPEQALHLLPSGSALIWRAYDIEPDAGSLRRLAAMARGKGCLLLLAGHPRLLMRMRADGLHLPERMLGRRFENGYVLSPVNFPPGLSVTAACHSERAIRAAAEMRLQAVLISPVFPTRSHPGARPFGVVRFAQLAKLARSLGLAPYALGGIESAADIRRLKETGAAGVAGISLLASQEP